MNGDEPRAGTKAPDFTLPDQNGKNHTLSECQGRWVLLCFYPHDNIPECAEEACTIRDLFPEFERFGVDVFCIGPDDMANHKHFAEKYHLPFTLLSDTHKKVADAYGAITKYNVFGEREGWVTQISFLVDLMGDVEKIYEELNPKVQIKKALSDLEKMHMER